MLVKKLLSIIVEKVWGSPLAATLLFFSSLLVYFFGKPFDYAKTGKLNTTIIATYSLLLLGSLFSLVSVIQVFSPLAKKNKLIVIIWAATIFILCIASVFYIKNVLDVDRIRYEKELSLASRANLELLGEKIKQYAKEHGGKLPDATRWCDMLTENYKELLRDNFINPKETNNVCHFAFNNNISGSLLDDLPEEVVLLFEAKGKWNLNGNSDLVRKRGSERKWLIGVLFVDGTFGIYYFAIGENVECFRSGKEFSQTLKWKP